MKKLCHSGKKNTFMKEKIKSIIKKLKDNQIFMKDLIEITNNPDIIHKNFFIDNIKKKRKKSISIKQFAILITLLMNLFMDTIKLKDNWNVLLDNG